ncbi:MAG TPA: SRPBCC domain-containing protein [Terracidiphilus sp.]|jgi:uncharacterized protein YndB with AHSA1/START domain|nr:SRPBCC domain-containing protein [Terracidiphilus sp.]
MNPALVCDDTIVQQITIKAPARWIFDALTDPKELLKWWNVKGKFQLIHAESDLRPGGKWSMQVAGSCGPDGPSSTVRGEYRVVEPPSLLLFTWIREEEDLPETLVRWDLEEKDGSTTVRVTHSGLTSERLRARNNGWPMIVKLLQTYIASLATN